MKCKRSFFRHSVKLEGRTKRELNHSMRVFHLEPKKAEVVLVATTRLYGYLCVCVSHHRATEVGASKSAPWTLLMGGSLPRTTVTEHGRWPHTEAGAMAALPEPWRKLPPRKSLALTHLLPCRKEPSPITPTSTHECGCPRCWCPRATPTQAPLPQ